MNFGEYIKDLALEKSLNENTLYKSQVERDALLADKSKVADAFVFNFLGVLGLINGAANTKDVAKLKRYFVNDKKLFVSSIGDDNNDTSLSVRLMSDADMFVNATAVNDITKFLARLKTGKIDPIDTRIVAGWLKKLKPDFVRNISDAQIKKAVNDFIQDGGETIDVSGLAILLKRKMRKFDVAGDFQEFAKRVKIADRKPPHTIGGTGVTTIDDMLAGAPVHSRAKKDIAARAAAAAATAPSTTPVPDATPAPEPTDKKTIRVAKAVPTPAPQPAKKAAMNKLLNPSEFVSLLFSSNRAATILKIEKDYKLSKDDLDYLNEFMESQDDLIKDIMSLNVPSVTDAFDKITDNINSAGIVTTKLTGTWVKDASNVIRNGYANREKYPASNYVDYVYDYEVDNNNVLGFEAESLPFVYNSALTFKSILIQAILGSKSYVNILGDYSYRSYGNINDPKSTPFKSLAMYLMKVASENATVQDVIESIDNSRAYYKNRAFSTMFEYLDLKTLAVDEYAGVNIKAAHEAHVRSISSLKEIPKSVQEEMFDEYRDKRKSFLFYDFIEKTYKEDFLQNGFKNSNYLKGKTGYTLTSAFPNIKAMFEDFDIDPRKMLEKYPDDEVLMDFIIREFGVEELSDKRLKSYVEKKVISDIRSSNSNYLSRMNITTDEDIKKMPLFVTNMFSTYSDLYRKSSNPEKINNLILETIEENPAAYDNPAGFNHILRFLPKMDKDVVIRLVKIAKKNGFKNFFNPDAYKNTNRKAEKDEFVSAFTGIMNDAIGTDVEDYISDILETMPGGVTYKIRQSLVGISKLVDEVNSGTIQPFGSIDDKRLKIMLSMNDINFASIVTADIGRKKKGETWVEYFKRAKDGGAKGGGSALGKEKVAITNEDTKSLTKVYNESFRSGRHGDTYAKINKIFTSDLEYPEFKEFRKTNFGDGTITPAFHGTGGIAATMILRYGFKVIKSTDPSVVGRMLGDGIYFSNKLDKALQYIGNSGYGRDYGTKGYIFEVDNTLGNEDKTRSAGNPDYRVMGLGGDNIRSPEWCVRDPKKQLAIRKVYEVELISKRMFDNMLNENEGLKGFKDFMIERKLMNIKNNVVSFLFRDGEIPILDVDGNTTFVDFEDALADGLIPENMIDYSMQGPVVVFDGANENKAFDIRFARTMNGEEYRLYEKYFYEKVLNRD